MPWKTVRKKTPCGWEEEEIWEEPAKTPAKVPKKKGKSKNNGYDVTEEFEKIRKKVPAIPA